MKELKEWINLLLSPTLMIVSMKGLLFGENPIIKNIKFVLYTENNFIFSSHKNHCLIF
jgi:hypothetical protein